MHDRDINSWLQLNLALYDICKSGSALKFSSECRHCIELLEDCIAL